MCSIGGFDTHSLQVVASDTTTGTHANLMKQLSDAVKAFMDDLKFLQIEDRVMGMTFSEFGRRIKSNSSVGTDHGAAAPLFVFGSKVNPGVLGVNPPIPANVTVNDNIPYQYDFRSVYGTLLQNWFCAGTTTVQTVLFKNFQSLPLIQSAACTSGLDDVNQAAGETLIVSYPNPFSASTRISFKTSGGHVLIQVLDNQGRLIANLVDKEYLQGKYEIQFNGETLIPGVYYLRFQNGPLQQVKSMLTFDRTCLPIFAIMLQIFIFLVHLAHGDADAPVKTLFFCVVHAVGSTCQARSVARAMQSQFQWNRV